MTNPNVLTTSSSEAAGFVYLGIDVSKDKLDICLLRESGKPLFQIYPNTAAGHTQLLAWTRKQSAYASRHFCLEATGSYSQAIALYLHESGEHVSLVNPAVIKYSGAGGAANKTDSADALKIAQFARLHKPGTWQPPAPEVRDLTALVRHLDDLVAQQAQIKGRLADPALVAPVRESLDALLAALSQQIKAIEDQIDRHIDAHPNLSRGQELLDSIPGIAKTTAQRLLAEMPPVSQCHCAQSAAAYAGLSPKEHRSGTSVQHRTRISKAGNRHLRRALYFPAISAIACNPRITAMAQRMRAAGKSKMAIIGAAMRKLVMIAYGVLKSGQRFNPEVIRSDTKSRITALTT